MRQRIVCHRPATMRQARLAVLRRPAAVVAGIAALAVLAACSSPASKPAVPSRPPVITTRSLPGLGSILVNASGYALYMFAPDRRSKVTCTSGCAASWPPVMVPAGSDPKAGAAVKAALLGTDPDPAGGRVVTYAGWPLYTYVGDTRPGEATGQALDMDGGLWYVMRPSGSLVR